jgi:rare lipoprotein A
MNGRNALRTGWTLAAAALIAGCAFAPTHVAVDSEHPAHEDPRGAQAVPAPAPPPAPPRPLVDVASWYGEWHQGRPTASGEPFDMTALTAAHRWLPLGACVEVTHLGNGRHVFVRVNDRGPYVPGRTIDLSLRAAEDLGMTDQGLARVRIRRARTEVCES